MDDAQRLQPAILTASQPLRVPGSGERRVLSPVAATRLAEESGVPRWEVEALALDLDVVPLHYLKNLPRYGREGQARLLRSEVALVGAGPVLERAADLLGASGVGRFRVLVPPAEGSSDRLAEGERIAAAGKNRNAGAGVTVAALPLRGGNPAGALQGLDCCAASLESSQDEQLLQFACRMVRAPLVLAAAEGFRVQATTVLPGDAGTALVYRPQHLHLSPDRGGGEPAQPQAVLAAGAWITEQVLALLLGEGDVLRGRLLYADLDLGLMEEFPLSA